MKDIYFVRHGDYDNPLNIIPFRSNIVSLSPFGIHQVTEDAVYFKDKKIQKVFSSPVLRCQETARIIANSLRKKVIVDDRLIEVGSPYAGYNFDKYREATRGVYLNLYNDPYHINNGGETIDDIFSRVNSLISEVIRDRIVNKVILVSHGDPIMIYIRKMQKLPMVSMDGPDYIPKGGIMHLIFDTDKKLVTYERVNF